MYLPMIPALAAAGGNSELLHNLKIAAIMIGAMLGVFAIPMAIAVWRYWSRMRPLAISMSFQDQQVFLYQLTEGVSGLGFRRTATPDGRVLFAPGGLQRMVGVMNIAVDLPGPNSALVSGPAMQIRRIKRWFPGAADQKYTGPTPYKRWVKGYLKMLAVGILLVLLLIGGAVFYDQVLRRPASASTQEQQVGAVRDIEQPLVLSAYDAAHGTHMKVVVQATGKVLDIKTPPGVSNGTRLRFRGLGIPGADGSPNGDLYLALSVK